jgi:microcystin-dependent protein
VPFLATPTVQLTARQSVAPGGNIVLIESDDAHFEVEHRDASGAPHTGGSAPVTGGRGATAESDWLAKKIIGGLDFRGVTRATYDSLGGAVAGRLVGLRLGQIGGEQNHVLSEAEMPYHTHSVYDPTHDHGIPEVAAGGYGSGGYQPGGNLANTALRTIGAGTGVQINFSGGNQAHTNIQPTRTVTTLIKLWGGIDAAHQQKSSSATATARSHPRSMGRRPTPASCRPRPIGCSSTG